MICANCDTEMKKILLTDNTFAPLTTLYAVVKHEWKDDKRSPIEAHACPKCGKIELRVVDLNVLGKEC